MKILQLFLNYFHIFTKPPQKPVFTALLAQKKTSRTGDLPTAEYSSATAEHSSATAEHSSATAEHSSATAEHSSATAEHSSATDLCFLTAVSYRMAAIQCACGARDNNISYTCSRKAECVERAGSKRQACETRGICWRARSRVFHTLGHIRRSVLQVPRRSTCSYCYRRLLRRLQKLSLRSPTSRLCGSPFLEGEQMS